MAIIQESRLISVNIGDSRIVLGCRDQNGQIISRALTKDHSLDDPQEHARITASGGRIFRTVSSSCSSKSSSGKRRNLHWGPVRVWLPEIDAPGLAMSRSLCDDVIHSVGVTSTLEFHEHLFDHTKDCLLIIATDGVWQYLSNQEAVNIAIDESEPSKASIRSTHRPPPLALTPSHGSLDSLKKQESAISKKKMRPMTRHSASLTSKGSEAWQRLLECISPRGPHIIFILFVPLPPSLFSDSSSLPDPPFINPLG
jgi:hypothetical protein